MSGLKMAVIGVGALGKHHARILASMPGVELVGVVETREEIGRPIAEQWNTTWYPDHLDLLDQAEAATIVVPTKLHREVAVDFLRNRIPVLIEKPLATNAQEGKLLARMSHNFQTLVQVGHIERFNSTLQSVLKQVSTPHYIRCERLSPFPFRSLDIGVVHDVMIHDLDLVAHMAGSPAERVEGFGTSLMGCGEDIVQARIRFENGCIADLTASRMHPTTSRSMQIWSETDCFHVDLLHHKVIRYSPTDSLRFGPSAVDRLREPGANVDDLKRAIFGEWIQIEEQSPDRFDALEAELRSFVDCVVNGTPPVVGVEAGLQALQLADDVVEAVQTHARSVSQKPLRRAG